MDQIGPFYNGPSLKRLNATTSLSTCHSPSSSPFSTVHQNKTSVLTLSVESIHNKIDTKSVFDSCLVDSSTLPRVSYTNMKTRDGDTAKSTGAKGTPPARKAATRANLTTQEPATPKTASTRRGSGGKATQAKTKEATPPQFSTSSGSKPEQSAVAEVNTLADTAKVTPVMKTVTLATRSGAKKKQVKTRTPPSRKATVKRTPKSQEAQKVTIEESPNEVVEDANEEELAIENVRESPLKEQSTAEVQKPVVENVAEGPKEEETVCEDDEELLKEDQQAMEVEPTEHMRYSVKKHEHGMEVARSSEDKEPYFYKKGQSGDLVEEKEPFVVEGAEFTEKEPNLEKKGEQGDLVKQKKHVVTEVAGSHENKEAIVHRKDEETDEDPEEDEEIKYVHDKEEPQSVPLDKEENMKKELLREDIQPELDDYGVYDGYEEYGDQVDYGEQEEEEFADDDIEEPAEESETLEDERWELNAVAKDRRIKKEHEIFVGGLDRDATEEDVKKVFERIGEIVEVRLHKNFSTNKNKGYAFVKFANKEHAKRALSEMKNPVICGKRCGTAPSEDNDTLFVGNICNTWTKEAIKQKLKDYGVEGVENINLVPDIQHEGLSRGFAFVVFSSHVDAMAAYKRLQKPDVVFGHPERTVKVAFAEPLREPDPEIMAHVKTVFLDGVPPYWTEDQVREQIKGYGEIIRVVLARNMSTAKRKDYGFVDFSTHESAVACINGINNKELGDGNSKAKVKARLSNPMPKTQAVKGGMAGGFRIGYGGSGSLSRFGKGFGRVGHHFNWGNSQRGRGFYQRGRGQISRMGPNEYGFDDRYTDSHRRQFIGQGGRRGAFRGGHHAPGRAVLATGPSRPIPSSGWHDGPDKPNPNRGWHDGPGRGYGEHGSHRRQPFSQGENFRRPFIGRQVDDPYSYDDRAHGVKRPFYAMDHDPDYTGPSRIRPRLDYNDPTIPFHGSRYHDNFGAHNGPNSDDYYVSNYGSYPPSYPHYYGDDRSYGGSYFY